MSKKYKCPKCLTTKFVIKQKQKKSSIQYLCKTCKIYVYKKCVHDDKAKYCLIEIVKQSEELLAFRGYNRLQKQLTL